MTVLVLLLGLLLTALIIAANGYFVAQEFAYMSVDRARLRARAASLLTCTTTSGTTQVVVVGLVT